MGLRWTEATAQRIPTAGGGAPAVGECRGVGEKPHGSKVKLLEWLGGAEQYWNDGSTASRAAAELGYGDEGAPVEV